jgi:hypothetical protein
MLPPPPVRLGPPCRRPILIATKYLVFRGQDTSAWRAMPCHHRGPEKAEQHALPGVFVPQKIAPLNVRIVGAFKVKQAAPNLICRVGSMKRFDPGIAFARRFIDREMGTRLALKAWYCDSSSRYTETGNLQPAIVRSAQAKRPEGDPKANRESRPKRENLSR